MQIELTLPCWLAVELLERHNRLTDFAKFQVLRKYDAESEISDFNEFAEFITLVDSNCYSCVADPEHSWYAYSFYQERTVEDIANELIEYALKIKFDTDYDTEYYRNSFEEWLHRKRIACARYFSNEMLEYLNMYHNENSYYLDDIAYEFYDYINHRGYQTVEEASAAWHERNNR